jgi:hypothetical protein
VFVLQEEGQPADKISHATKGEMDKRENCVGQAEGGDQRYREFTEAVRETLIK